MSSILLMVGSFVGYLIAYNLYGKFLSKKIFKIDNKAITPSESLNDGKDFVPTKKGVLFGHHFTSIAGLGPIVGPAIAIIWGWVPAVLWIFFGSIFLGAVHDFGVLILSMRHKGTSIGDISATLISPRIRIMFLIIMFITNLMVIAVFTLIIAILFGMYPSAVIPVWSEVPIAILLGYMMYKKGANHLFWGIIAVILMFVFVVIGVYNPISLPEIAGINPLVIWAIVLLIYAYFASILPVTTLLQPRDYINSHQLFIILFLLVLGVFVSNPVFVAPAINPAPEGAPSILPFIFIVIACGAISGFHSLVSGGTTSKQCANESDTLPIAYGGMLTEGFLAILVIIAVGAGIGLGFEETSGNVLTGTTAFATHYGSWASANGLAPKLKAFVFGSANLMAGYGLPMNLSLTLMGVFLVSFASTTLDSATRVQRYIVSEFAHNVNMPSLAKPHPATIIAIGITALLCFNGGFTETALKKGALALWPLFGVTNQLLAALALLTVTVYLAKKKIMLSITIIPGIFMAIITIWGSIDNIQQFLGTGNILLLSISIISLLLEIWIIMEIIRILRKTDLLPDKVSGSK
ncbi:MAG: carbon starvation protein A [Bacteroidetes bacterium]|nr:carbon starvation protein A [Bacteroidota bacterium]MBU1113921.1 carbon starvation protein A [Bacteroidota bacterium]MBU1798240.1 carbon starvation protein A [Bacteroidota bacterium]